MSIYKKICVLVACIIANTTNAGSCLDKSLILSDFVTTPIANQAILNSKPVELKMVFSPRCSLECYMETLNKKGVEFSKQGNLLYIHEKKGITVEILSASTHSFQGRFICQSEEQYQRLELPLLFNGRPHSSDLQSTDGNHISRTVFFSNIPRIVLTQQIAIFQKKAQEVDITKNSAYFLLPDSSELYLSYQESSISTNVVVIYVKNRRGHD
ncbi:hypothetical protein [Acinetobacter nectaris]|uniref:hypothetical protein n=1 Tax=Acinetobacter nectaris TaxID=1219382 RepID=UPI001F44EEB2|nr:hypothetical protein [Acinetobacter nectaris]MCF9047109.1 hypothetical protein [Acinetobacter nectaris]